MQINVETKPVASAAYQTKKKRLVETIDRLYHRDARVPLQKMISRVHPADMASILDELPPAHVVDIFHALSFLCRHCNLSDSQWYEKKQYIPFFQAGPRSILPECIPSVQHPGLKR